MDVGVTIMRVAIVVILVAGIAVGCYFLLFNNKSDKSDPDVSLEIYDKILVSDDYKEVHNNITNDTSYVNAYSSSVDSKYNIVRSIYNAEFEIMSNLIPDIYFCEDSKLVSKISGYLDDYKTCLSATNESIKVFKTDKDASGDTPTTAQTNNLKAEFLNIVNNIVAQNTVLYNINSALLPYAQQNVYGGDKIIKYNTKLILIESLYKQFDKLRSVQMNDKATVPAVLLSDSNNLYAKYMTYKSQNFTRNADTVGNDTFLADYQKIDKNTFFNAESKVSYRDTVQANDATQGDIVSRVMAYLGFV